MDNGLRWLDGCSVRRSIDIRAVESRGTNIAVDQCIRIHLLRRSISKRLVCGSFARNGCDRTVCAMSFHHDKARHAPTPNASSLTSGVIAALSILDLFQT